MIRLELDDASHQTIKQFLARLDQISHPTESDIEPIQTAIRAGFMDSFDAEAGADEPWAELRPATNLDRERQGYPPAHPILIRTGIYRESFINPGGDHISEWFADDTGIVIQEGSNDYRIWWHEYGTENMSARTVLDLSGPSVENVASAIEMVFDRWFDEAT